MSFKNIILAAVWESRDRYGEGKGESKIRRQQLQIFQRLGNLPRVTELQRTESEFTSQVIRKHLKLYLQFSVLAIVQIYWAFTMGQILCQPFASLSHLTLTITFKKQVLTVTMMNVIIPPVFIWVRFGDDKRHN